MKKGLPLEWHVERAVDMLKGSFNITPFTVGEAYHRYLNKAVLERLK